MKIFVYGTLKRGLSNHEFIRQQQFLSEAKTEPLYRMFDLVGYPGLTRSEEGGYSVEGEVWEVDAPGLRLLDALEDVAGGEYERVPMALSGEWADCGVEGYLYLRSMAGGREVGACWTEG